MIQWPSAKNIAFRNVKDVGSNPAATRNEKTDIG